MCSYCLALLISTKAAFACWCVMYLYMLYLLCTWQASGTSCFLPAAVIRSQVNTVIPRAGLVWGFIDVDWGTDSCSRLRDPKQFNLNEMRRPLAFTEHQYNDRHDPEITFRTLLFCFYTGEWLSIFSLDLPLCYLAYISMSTDSCFYVFLMFSCLFTRLSFGNHSIIC